MQSWMKLLPLTEALLQEDRISCTVLQREFCSMVAKLSIPPSPHPEIRSMEMTPRDQMSAAFDCLSFRRTSLH